MARPDIAARETPATPLLEARSITKSFLGVTALDHVDFVLNRGEIHALLGENGAGKSTLIKILTGAYHGFDGSILLEGQAIAPASVAEAQTLGIGTVYQEVNLLENLTVAENLFLGRQPRRLGFIDRRRMEKDATTLLARYGLTIDVGAPLSAYSVAIRQIIATAPSMFPARFWCLMSRPPVLMRAKSKCCLACCVS
jgi:simple sugar transport system ATP-binding protein